MVYERARVITLNTPNTPMSVFANKISKTIKEKPGKDVKTRPGRN
jgi:hypothetical protein